MDTSGRTEAREGRCPECGADLEHVDTRRYQSLSEHVCTPNAEPHPKPGYACPNELCEAQRDGARWLDTGEGPYYPTAHSPEKPQETP